MHRKLERIARENQFATITHIIAKYKIIIPTGLKPFPAGYEISAAALLANYFKADVEFIPRSNQKTPDLLIKALTGS